MTEEETKIDLSQPEHNWLIRRYKAACKEEAEALAQQIDNDIAIENLKREMREAKSPIQAIFVSGHTEVGRLRVSPGMLAIKVTEPSTITRWHPFDELPRYSFALADANSDLGFRETPGFENVYGLPLKGKKGADAISNFDAWLQRVDEHQNLNTGDVHFKFDQAPMIKLHEFSALLKGLEEYKARHPPLLPV